MTDLTPHALILEHDATPIIDAIIRAACARSVILAELNCNATRPCDGSRCECGLAETVWVALRAALPWEPTPETIEAMASAVWTEFHAMRWFYEETYEEASEQMKTDYRQLMLAAYRAEPIMRELYPELFGESSI